jgi:hypothetical protein
MIEYLKWLFNSKCDHKRVMCIHGDEINATSGKRGRCLDCPKYLQGLPDYCYYTKELH